ncbi:hypothetical protein OAO87_03935 [bacterium]|nr:hypothetical protein [bacterium]
MAAPVVAPNCKWTEEAKAILTGRDAAQMVRAIAVVEKQPTVTVETLAGLGAGTLDGVMLSDCTTGIEAKKARAMCAMAYFLADEKAMRKAFATQKGAAGKTEALAVMGVKVRSIVKDALVKLEPTEPSAKGTERILVRNEDDKDGAHKALEPRLAAACEALRV